MPEQGSLFEITSGHDGAPPRVEPRRQPEPRPRDRATVQRQHRDNAARVAATFDDHIRAFLLETVERAEARAGAGAWSSAFRFESDGTRALDDCPSVRGYVFRRKGKAPAADSCRRRGTKLADDLGLDLHSNNGTGLYRVRRPA